MAGDRCIVSVQYILNEKQDVKEIRLIKCNMNLGQMIIRDIIKITPSLVHSNQYQNFHRDVIEYHQDSNHVMLNDRIEHRRDVENIQKVMVHLERTFSRLQLYKHIHRIDYRLEIVRRGS
jgi:hypothetical protein